MHRTARVPAAHLLPRRNRRSRCAAANSRECAAWWRSHRRPGTSWRLRQRNGLKVTAIENATRNLGHDHVRIVGAAEDTLADLLQAWATRRLLARAGAAGVGDLDRIDARCGGASVLIQPVGR